jgi:hypothetical protein
VLRITVPALLLAATLVACKRTPTPKECEDAFAQLQRIATEGRDKNASELGQAYLDSVKAKYMERCTKEGTREEIDCMMNARTLDDLDKCAGLKK